MSELCVADEACRVYDRREQLPAEATNTPLCDGCLRAGERAVGQLVYDYRDLEQHLPRQSSQQLDGQPGHTDEAKIPIRTDVEALQRAIWWVTFTWAEILTRHGKLADPPYRVRDGFAVAWACRIIAPRAAVLARLPGEELADYPLLDEGVAIRHRSIALADITGAEGVLDMIWLHDRARSMLGLTKLTRHLPGYCQQPKCAKSALEQENGSDTVRCAACGHTQTRDDYERYSNVFLRPSEAMR